MPSPLAHLVMRCLSKNPADRPQSAREILEDIDDVDLSGQRVRSGPYPAPPYELPRDSLATRGSIPVRMPIATGPC